MNIFLSEDMFTVFNGYFPPLVVRLNFTTIGKSKSLC